MPKQIKYIYNHAPQLEANCVPASVSLNLWGRGTGKTYGLTGQRSYFFVVSMPKSIGAIGCPSFQHMMEHIFPQILKSWKTIGLREGEDFVCFKEPPAEWDQPHLTIKDYKRVISFRNGSAIKLFSFNYNSLTNGDSIDWVIIDEARLCKEEKVVQSLKCLRGNEEYFGHLSQHKSVTFVSDMPHTVSEFWLLEYLKQVDKVRETRVKQLVKDKAYCQGKLLKEKRGKIYKNAWAKLIADIDSEMNKLCIDFTYVSLASSLENIYVLGIQTLKNWKRTDTDIEFRMAVLNEIPQQVKNCYYSQLNPDRSRYYSPKPQQESDIDYLAKKNWTWDGDIDLNQGLYIAMDYNSDITCLSVGQMEGNTIKLLKSFYVTTKRKDVVVDFYEYYKDLLDAGTEVYYFFDNTAIVTDADKAIDESYAAKTVSELGWLGVSVTPIHLTQTTHSWRYSMWESILSGGDDNHPFDFKYNFDNNEDWEYAAQHTRVENRITKDGKAIFGKDKSDEKKRKIPPEKTTHLTECVDTLTIGLMMLYNEGDMEPVEGRGVVW